MSLVIEPSGYSFRIAQIPWSWEKVGGDILLHAERFPDADLSGYPINSCDHVLSGFSIWVNNRIVYQDHSRNKGFLIFTNSHGGNVVAISLIDDPGYDPVSDLICRMNML